MGINRRDALLFLTGGLVGSLVSPPLHAEAPGPIYLSARTDPAGGHRVSGFSACGAQRFDLPLPSRGHSFAVHPGKRVAVHFARRPGRFARVVDLVRGTIVCEFETPADRHFCGHGVFSPDGRLLYASENDFEGERGVIGVYDAEDDYRRVGELASHGIGPHDIQLLSDGETLVVANGGILTRPDLPGVKLNLPTMASSLCFVDRRDGALLQEHRLDRLLHRLSIRHLAVGKDDTVAVAMQYQGPAGDLVPLVAVHGVERRWHVPLRDRQLDLLQGPSGVLRAMKQYCGSVCFDSSGGVIAVSAPRGNIVTFWNAVSGDYLSSARVLDGSGVAPGVRSGEFLACSGRGGVAVIQAWSSDLRQLDFAFVKASRWDNHLIAVTVT